MIKTYSIKKKIKTSKKIVEAFAMILVIFIAYGCSSGVNTGINKDINKQKRSSKLVAGNYTIKDVNIDVININKLNENQIKN